MMYMFPRQFGLHNVFTSEIDKTRTAQKFQDYTLREEEIASVTQSQSKNSGLPKSPRRLRGAATNLVERLQVRHGRCSYFELLKHYCPSTFDPTHRYRSPTFTRDLTNPSRNIRASVAHKNMCQDRARIRRYERKTQSQPHHPLMPQFDSLAELACPNAHVSAFCQSVLSRIIPDGFWGEGDTMEHNKKAILRKVDHFIKLRRFETMSLHEIIQDLKASIPYGDPNLEPPLTKSRLLKLRGYSSRTFELGRRARLTSTNVTKYFMSFCTMFLIHF